MSRNVNLTTFDKRGKIKYAVELASGGYDSLPYCQNCRTVYPGNAQLCSACGIPLTAAPSRPNQVRVIGLWQLFMGGWNVWIGFLLFDSLEGNQGETLAAMAFVLAILFLTYGICTILLAVFLLQMRNWARKLSMGIHGINLYIGVRVAFYGEFWYLPFFIASLGCLWVLGFNKEIKKIFVTRPKASKPRPTTICPTCGQSVDLEERVCINCGPLA